MKIFFRLVVLGTIGVAAACVGDDPTSGAPNAPDASTSDRPSLFYMQ